MPIIQADAPNITIGRCRDCFKNVMTMDNYLIVGQKRDGRDEFVHEDCGILYRKTTQSDQKK